MGIFVPTATLPSGITVNNVYMSFTNEVLYVMQSPNDQYQMTSYCNVFLNRSMAKGGTPSNIRFNVTTKVSNVMCGYQALYNELKTRYPSASDVIEPKQITPMSNLTLSIQTLRSIFNELASPPTENTGNLVMTTDVTSQFSNIINTFTFPPETEPEPITLSIQTLRSIFNELASPPTENTGSLVMTTGMASQFSNIIQSFTFPPEPASEPEEKIEATE